VLSFDLPGKGGPTSSYATTGIALWIIAPRKPPYPTKMPSSRWRYFKEEQNILLVEILEETAAIFVHFVVF